MSAGRAERMKLVRKLRKAGFDVERTGSGHWRVSNGQGGTTILAFSPRSSGTHVTMKKLKAIGYEE